MTKRDTEQTVDYNKRDTLRNIGLAVAGLALAGCSFTPAEEVRMNRDPLIQDLFANTLLNDGAAEVEAARLIGPGKFELTFRFHERGAFTFINDSVAGRRGIVREQEVQVAEAGQVETLSFIAGTHGAPLFIEVRHDGHNGSRSVSHACFSPQRAEDELHRVARR